MRDEIRRMALFTSGLVELTRNRAEALVRDLVKAGEVPRQQASSVVHELMDRSRANRAEVMALIRSEIQNQIAGLGLATARDVQRLERRVARLEGAAKPTAKSARKSTKKTASRRRGGTPSQSGGTETSGRRENNGRSTTQKPPAGDSGE